MFGNLRLTTRQNFENLRKSSENCRKSSKNRQKPCYTSLNRIIHGCFGDYLTLRNHVLSSISYSVIFLSVGPLVVEVDLYVESFANIAEANMVGAFPLVFEAIFIFSLDRARLSQGE